MRMNMSQGEELENPVTPPRMEVIKQINEPIIPENSKWNNLIEKEDPTKFYHLNESKENEEMKFVTSEPELPTKRKRYYERKQYKYSKYNKFNKYNTNKENEIDEEENRIENENFRNKRYNTNNKSYTNNYVNANYNNNMQIIEKEKINVNLIKNEKKPTLNTTNDNYLTNALLKLVNNESDSSSGGEIGNNPHFVIDDNLIVGDDNNLTKPTSSKIINPNSKWNSFL